MKTPSRGPAGLEAGEEEGQGGGAENHPVEHKGAEAVAGQEGQQKPGGEKSGDRRGEGADRQDGQVGAGGGVAEEVASAPEGGAEDDRGHQLEGEDGGRDPCDAQEAGGGHGDAGAGDAGDEGDHLGEGDDEPGEEAGGGGGVGGTGGAVGGPEQRAAEDERQGDDPGFTVDGLDGRLGEDRDDPDAGGADDDGGQAGAGVAGGAAGVGQQVAPLAGKRGEGGDAGAEMDGDGEGEPGEQRRIPVGGPGDQDQVPGTADGQELGYALDGAQDDGGEPVDGCQRITSPGKRKRRPRARS